jgi:hypothetical protein
MVCTLALMTLVFGCAQHGGTPVRASAPGEFAWARGAIEARGTGSAPVTVSSEPQRSVIARRAAKTAAITNLKQQMSRISVTDAQTLGSVMAQNLGVKRAIEQALQSAQVESEREVGPGVYEARMRFPLAPIAEILMQNHITPEGVPETPQTEATGIPPLS